MDIFVLPSWYEGLPVVSVEAQANGLPCLFSSQITDESKLTDTARFIELFAGAKKWAAAILADWNGRNRLAKKQLQMAGFDINRASALLQNMYIQAIEGEEASF